MLANLSKLSKRGFGRICAVEEMAYIVTDTSIWAAEKRLKSLVVALKLLEQQQV